MLSLHIYERLLQVLNRNKYMLYVYKKAKFKQNCVCIIIALWVSFFTKSHHLKNAGERQILKNIEIKKIPWLYKMPQISLH